MVRCALFLLLLCSFRLSSTAETGHESEPDVQSTGASEEPGVCMLTEETLVEAINASTHGALTEAVVNCFAYRDGNRSLYNAIVSGMGVTANGVRYVVECVNNVLLLTESLEPFTNLTAHCARCQDNSSTTDLCAPGEECASNCTACFGPTQSECLACEIARFENECVSECPPYRTPNSENGNECECSGYFFGTNCTECDLVCDGEDGAYFLDPESCLCVTECPVFIELLDYMATVPEEIIGSPNSEDESEMTGGITGHERKRNAWHKNFRRAEESTHAEPEFVPEPGICVSDCTIPSYGATTSTDNVCYACHHTFCLECNTTSGQCLQCRDGTLLNSSALGDNEAEFCLGFYDYIEELAEELEHEEEEELARFEEEQQHLIIFVPIACGVAFIFFVSMALFAHFRYPHHGEKKRHRKPREETANISEFERSLRPQNTTRYR